MEVGSGESTELPSPRRQPAGDCSSSVRRPPGRKGVWALRLTNHREGWWSPHGFPPLAVSPGFPQTRSRFVTPHIRTKIPVPMNRLRSQILPRERQLNHRREMTPSVQHGIRPLPFGRFRFQPAHVSQDWEGLPLSPSPPEFPQPGCIPKAKGPPPGGQRLRSAKDSPPQNPADRPPPPEVVSPTYRSPWLQRVQREPPPSLPKPLPAPPRRQGAQASREHGQLCRPFYCRV